MVAALGGALFFGASRRLWDEFSTGNALWGATGLVLLANSRPLEGILGMLPIVCLFLRRVWQDQEWKNRAFWQRMVIPSAAVIMLGMAAIGFYNRAITGSALTPPYLLHEQQYQESPQFIFMNLRPNINYSSYWLRYYYEIQEMRLYLSQRTPNNFLIMTARKLMTWWAFYCGILLSAPLVLLGLSRVGWIRYSQAVLLCGFLLIAATYSPRSAPSRIAIDVLALAQIVLLWFAFDAFWPRLALATSSCLIFVSLFVKYFFPHYFAPAACLVLYLQMESLRRLWHWRTSSLQVEPKANRRERRRVAMAAARNHTQVSVFEGIRGMAILLPIACLASLGVRIAANVYGWSEDPHSPDRATLLRHDWSLERASMEQQLNELAGPQMVFIRYFRNHYVNNEWVYNRADLLHAKVIWARDLGKEHNQLLLRRFPNRTPWLVEADQTQPKLIPYSEAPEAPLQPPAFIFQGHEEPSTE